MRIRRAQPADAADLTGLALRSKASWGYPAEWVDAWIPDLTFTPEYLTAHRTFLAEHEERAVGVIVLQEHPTHWSLGHLWIDPTVQRQGVGRTLVAYALSVAETVHPARVMVIADPNAEAFYRRLGAIRVGSQAAPMPGAPARALPVLEFRRTTSPDIA
jgi:predicted N-acetyltransferase YhbS